MAILASKSIYIKFWHRVCRGAKSSVLMFVERFSATLRLNLTYCASSFELSISRKHKRRRKVTTTT